MQIGLITIYHVPNFGSVLQTFATQTVLEKLGCKCRIIKYVYPNDWHYSQGWKKSTLLYRSLRRYLGITSFSIKELKLQLFRLRRLHFTKTYYSLDSLLSENWANYDAFVVGSDQVWNPRFLLGDNAFLLSFVPHGKPRYSIASSFAQKELPSHLVSKYRKELKQFNGLSVREYYGVEIIRDQLGIDSDVSICLDPTLLLSRAQWLSALRITTNINNSRPYILVYMLRYAFEPQPYIWEVVKHFQSRMGCDVIALAGYTKPEHALGINMKDATSSSVKRFIELFANASLVVTSSFHGTAFALNFGQPLISITPQDSSDDRQSSLLNSVGASSSIANIGTNPNEINPVYDNSLVSKRIQELRMQSIEWITSNIVK